MKTNKEIKDEVFDEFSDLVEQAEGADYQEEEFDLSDGASAVDPEFPFWRLKRDSMASVLKVVADISQRSSDMISKSVLFKQAGDSVIICSTNKDIYFKCRIPLENEENILKRDLIFSIKQIFDVVRFSSSIIIFEQDGKILSQFLNGKSELITFDFDHKVFTIDFPEEVQGTITHEELVAELNLYDRLMSLATESTEKRITVKKGQAYGSFLSILVKSSSILPSMVVKVSDARDLATILGKLYNDNCKIAVKDSRAYFWSQGFKYSSLQQASFPTDELDRIFVDVGTGDLIDTAQTFRILSYLSTTASDLTAVKFERSMDGTFVSQRTTQGRTSRFNLSSSSVATPSNFEVQLDTSRKIFNLLRAYPSVFLTRTKEGVVYSDQKGLFVMQSARDSQ